jgi:D-sedoheptulose 7-phosphate isomerase
METIRELTSRYPGLEGCAADVENAAAILIDAYKNGHALYTCGNGGSAADADHIVGELMKGFLKKRPVNAEFRAKLAEAYPEQAEFLADNLQCGLPAVSLHSQSALLTAFANDVDASMMYAQTLYALGRADDVLIAISFPRYSNRVVTAVEYAHRAGADVIALTDSAASPIAAYANQLLTAQSDMASFMDSLVAPLSIINALIVALSRKRQEDLTERLRHLEQIWEDYEVYDSKSTVKKEDEQ